MSFYTYAHYTKDTKELFYIGKGKNRRAFQIYGRNRYWKNKVAKHGGFTVKILAKWKSEIEAFEHEKFLVSCFKGSLVNLTDGGEGCSGFVQSEEAKAKRSIALKGKPLTEERKKNIVLSLVGRKLAKEHAEKSRKNLEKIREKQKRKVFCKTTGQIFDSVTEACKVTKVDASSIVKACKGVLKKAGGKEWSYDDS